MGKVSTRTIRVTSRDRFVNLVPYGARRITASFVPLDTLGVQIVNIGPGEREGGGSWARAHNRSAVQARPCTLEYLFV